MYINRRGVALCALSGVLILSGGYYALGPSYLHNPVVTATVTGCRGSGPARYCVASWPDGHGGTDRGGVAGLTNGRAGERLRVKATGDSSATTRLTLSAGGWFFRELLAAIPFAAGVVLAIFLYKRRRRFITENPDQLPELATQRPSA